MTEHEKPVLDDIEGSEPTKKLKTENVLEQLKEVRSQLHFAYSHF